MLKRKIVINRKPKTVIETEDVHSSAIIELDSDTNQLEIYQLRYMLFKTFLAYLKASKTWNVWQGGWIHNKLRIQQRWDNYIVNYNNKQYSVSPEKSDNISEIILYYM